MALSAFDDESSPPDAPVLAATLGRASRSWDLLVARLQSELGPLEERWGFAGRAYGWSLRLSRKKRAIVYMTPCRSHFVASFALGEKACRAASDAGLRPDILAIIDASPRYAEGRGVRIPVRRRTDVDAVCALAAIKLAC